MKKLAILLFLPLIVSCGGNSSKEAESGNLLGNLTFTVDTVLVDPGSEIINLAAGLRLSTINEEAKFLYLFDRNSSQIQKIDLNELKLSGSQIFEKEGPNGIGNYTSAIRSISGDRFIFVGQPKLGVFSSLGELTPEMSFNFADFGIVELSQPFLARNGFVFNELTKKGYFLSGGTEGSFFRLAIVDFESKNAQFLDLPHLERMADYRILFNDNGLRRFFSEQIFIQEFGLEILIGSSVGSGIYKFNQLTDSLIYLEFPHQLTPAQKTVKIKTVVNSEQELEEQRTLSQSDIRFYEMLWDKTTNRFYRFGSRQIGLSSDEIKELEVFIYAYNSDLRLIGESWISGISKVPEFPFFKDGKLWSYVNVEDELGFAVMDFKF